MPNRITSSNFPHLCAHQGLSLACPENTLPAFAAAMGAGAHEIEFDVQTSRDGVLVVCHDDSVDRTTDGRGKVAELTWGEIRTLDAGIRPMAFTTNPDGSTKHIVVQLSDFHGFAVVDFATRKEIRRIPLPDPPGLEKEERTLQGSPAHGLAITPDEKMLWSTSKWYHSVVAYSLPEYKLLKVVDVGEHPDWLAITPDGKSLYVAAAGDDVTVVVDIKTMTVVDKIPVGAVPKRNTAGVLRIN